MHSLNDTALESNKYMKINFDGGDLSSDAGLLLIKEFACKLGFDKILKSEFKTNDSAMFRIHKDNENLLQMVYQILGAYFEDDCADELTNDPVLTAILGKQALASQPTLSRFFNLWMIPHFASFMTSCVSSVRLSMPSGTLRPFFWIWILHCLIPTGIRKGKALTSIIRIMVTTPCLLRWNNRRSAKN